jgi:hypothetical protein
METNPQRDEVLWRVAKKRAEFKRQLITYIFINILVWLIWAFTGITKGELTFPWPIFVTFGWGIGLAFSYFGAYVNQGQSLEEKEYEKLKTGRE